METPDFDDSRKIRKYLGDEFAKDKPEHLPSPRWNELIRLCKSDIMARRKVDTLRKTFDDVGSHEVPEYCLVELSIKSVLEQGSASGDPFLIDEKLIVDAWHMGLSFAGLASYVIATRLGDILAGGCLTVLSILVVFITFARQLRLKKYRLVWHLPYISLGCIFSFLIHGAILFLKN